MERLWKSIKYEEVYLHAYDSVSAAKAGIARYVGFYNCQHCHPKSDGQTPDTVYFHQPQLAAAVNHAEHHLKKHQILFNCAGPLLIFLTTATDVANMGPHRWICDGAGEVAVPDTQRSSIASLSVLVMGLVR